MLKINKYTPTVYSDPFSEFVRPEDIVPCPGNYSEIAVLLRDHDELNRPSQPTEQERYFCFVIFFGMRFWLSK